MKLYGVSMVRNEGDILESWVRYHLQLFDGLLIVDHASVDSTSEILEDLVQEGLPIEVTRREDTGYEQASVVTDLARKAAGNGADWVFPLDADEFLNVRGADCRQVLAHLDDDSPLALPWQTYVPRHVHDHAETNPLIRITWRLRDEAHRYDKVAFPGEIMRDMSTTVALGSHSLLNGDEPVPSAAGPQRWSIAHFPVRSVEQLARKAFVGWISSLALPDRKPRSSHQWKKWFHYLIEQDLSELDPGQLAMSYLNDGYEGGADVELVYDPLPAHLCGFEVKHTGGETVSPLRALALAAESQAADLAAWQRESSSLRG